jgi:hypothetical protein
MNKLLTNINGKMPLFLDDIRFLDDIYRTAINNIIKGLIDSTYGEKLIVSGCVPIVNISTMLCTVSAGMVMINGELCLFAGSIFTYNSSKGYRYIINESYDPIGTRIFGDSTEHACWQIRVAGIEEVDELGNLDLNIFDANLKTKLTNRTVEMDVSSVVITNNLGLFITEPLKTAHNKNFGNQPGSIPEIGANFIANAVFESNSAKKIITSEKKSAYNKNFSTQEEVLAGESNNTIVNPLQLQNHGDWQTPTYNTGWFGYNVVGNPFKYRKTTSGYLELYGDVGSNGILADKVCTLPAEYRPQFRTHIIIPGANITTYHCIIETNGDISISFAADSFSYYFNVLIPL